MNLNPITALSDQLQKLINEKGSAAILRDHLALFKEQVLMLDKKITTLNEKTAALESENSILKTENAQLKSEAQNIRIANNELAAKIQIYENPKHNNLLNDANVKILKFLFTLSDQLTADEIARYIGLNIQIVKFHLEELEKKRMVHGALYIGSPRKWVLIQEGRRYLIENNLVS